VWFGLPMGAGNSPAIACRINNGAIRQMKERHTVFQGDVVLNTWSEALATGKYDERFGHGRMLMGKDGLPTAIVFSMVDDYFVHAPTMGKCDEAFGVFMDTAIRLGLICQPHKTKPPGRIQKFCGMMMDTTGIPRIVIPEEKVARAIVTIDYILGLDDTGILSRLSASVLGGLLQSLVVATPSRQGQTYLRSLYNDVHHTSPLYGKALYYTTMKLSDETRADLKDWWCLFLHKNPGNRSRAGYMSTVGVSWGDGSGTGMGGMFEFAHNNEDPILTWMGTWSPLAAMHDSNWQELRTLLWTMERLDRQGADLQGGTLFYFTDNLVSYYIAHNGSSTSRELHKLIRRIKILEIKMDCRVELVHVPGKLVIEQCTNGLSRGIWASPERVLRSSVEESWLALTVTPYSPIMGQWALHLVGHSPNRVFVHHPDTSEWTWPSIGDQTTIWTPSPEIGRQAVTRVLDYWVEHPHTTNAIFLIPRVLQQDWGYLSRHILEYGVFLPQSLPWGCRYQSLIPFCVLYLPCYIRTLPRPNRVEPTAVATKSNRWHGAQADHVRGLQTRVFEEESCPLRVRVCA
jgi:hypothetical protein